MATIQNQLSLSENRRQRAMALQPKATVPTTQTFDETTTEGQVLATRQALQSARIPLQEFNSQYLYPKKRERAFTDRRTRSQIVQAGRGVSEQLGQVKQQEQTFEREVAIGAPEYALAEQKQQALTEAKQSIQSRIDSLTANILSYQQKLNSLRAEYDVDRDALRQRKKQLGDRYSQKVDELKQRYNEKEDKYQNKIEEYKAELSGYSSGIGGNENDIIKKYFSGYTKKYAQYLRDVERSRNEQNAAYKQQLQDPKFKEQLATLGLGSNASLSQYNQAVKKYNNDIAYKNQLLKFAEQKGGVQFLSPEQQKALGFDSQGFDYYKTPQSGYVDPRTGRVIEMSIKDDYAKSMGYLPVQIQGINSKTGEYITSSTTSLLTSQQQKMYDLFKQSPEAAAAYGFKINQSQILPTEFVLRGSTQPAETQKFDASTLSFLNIKSGGAYDVAMTTKPFTEKESQIMEYRANPNEFIKRYGYGLTDEGQILYSGQASPIIITKGPGSWKSAFDLATIVTGVKAVKVFGAPKALGFIFSEQIKSPIDYAYQKTYQPTSFIGQFGKAALTSFLVMSSPALSASYGYSFAKSAVTNPKLVYESVVQQVKERPGELAGFLVGGALIKRGLGYAEYKLRGGVETKTVNLPGYGEVIVQNIPKFRQVVWIKGTFSASEKVKIMTQINSLLGKGNRIFVQVSGQGIPMNVFSASKNLGFQVAQLQNPMRGLYQAPPFQFLKKYQSLTNTRAGALSYYAGQFKRDSILPNPLKAIKALLTKDTITRQRPFQYLERTGSGVQMPRWVQSVAKALDSGKGIPKSYQTIINKYFKSFLEKPLEYKGKTYLGLEKLKLVNQINLRGKGSGVKLKVYAALLEYQNINRVRLVGGPEVLSGISPFGPESQVVAAIGTKFFAKSAKDLRVGVKPTIISKVVEFITGTKRGQYVSRIDGQLVEIMPVRSFPGRIKAKVKLTKVSKVESLSFDNLLSNIKPTKTSVVGEFIRRRTAGESVSPPRPFPLTQRTREVRRVDRPVISRNPLIVVRDEIRRTEQRRPLDRIIPRVPIRATRDRPVQRARPELRRVDVRVPRRDLLIPRRPEVPRRPETRVPQGPTQNQLMRTLTIRPQPEKKKQPERQPVRRPQRYNILPTITQQIYRVRRKGGKVKRPTGFELLRI